MHGRPQQNNRYTYENAETGDNIGIITTNALRAKDFAFAINLKEFISKINEIKKNPVYLKHLIEQFELGFAQLSDDPQKVIMPSIDTYSFVQKGSAESSISDHEIHLTAYKNKVTGQHEVSKVSGKIKFQDFSFSSESFPKFHNLNNEINQSVHNYLLNLLAQAEHDPAVFIQEILREDFIENLAKIVDRYESRIDEILEPVENGIRLNLATYTAADRITLTHLFKQILGLENLLDNHGLDKFIGAFLPLEKKHLIYKILQDYKETLDKTVAEMNLADRNLKVEKYLKMDHIQDNYAEILAHYFGESDVPKLLRTASTFIKNDDQEQATACPKLFFISGYNGEVLESLQSSLEMELLPAPFVFQTKINSDLPAGQQILQQSIECGLDKELVPTAIAFTPTPQDFKIISEGVDEVLPLRTCISIKNAEYKPEQAVAAEAAEVKFETPETIPQPLKTRSMPTVCLGLALGGAALGVVGLFSRNSNMVGAGMVCVAAGFGVDLINNEVFAQNKP